jgi:hypothetical protein
MLHHEHLEAKPDLEREPGRCPQLRGRRTGHVGCHRLDPAPRFLLATARHAQGGCLAFVRVEVSCRDRPVARERPADRQRSSDRGIASEPNGWRSIRHQGEGAAEVGQSRTRNGTRRDRTRAPQEEARSESRNNAAGAESEERGIPVSKLRPEHWSLKPSTRVTRARPRTEGGRRPQAAPTPMKRGPAEPPPFGRAVPEEAARWFGLAVP